MCLNADFVEGCGPGSYGLVGVLSEEKVHLLKCTAVSLDPVETAHVDDYRCYLNELVNPRDVFARRLPHIPVYEGEFDFTCHTYQCFVKKFPSNIENLCE